MAAPTRPSSVSPPGMSRRRRRGATILAALAALTVGLATPGVAANGPPATADTAPAWTADLGPGDLTVALTALEDDGGRGPCRATLRIRNDSQHRVETFSVRLVLFDPGGAVLRQVVVLAMPLRPQRTTDATFPALPGPCSRLGAVALRDFPLCADRRGRRLDCRAAAVAVSRVGPSFGF